LPELLNEHYRVRVDPANGSITVTDRVSGSTLGPANVFVDGGEAGDLYTYCPPAQDTVVSSAAGAARTTTGTRENGGGNSGLARGSRMHCGL